MARVILSPFGRGSSSFGDTPLNTAYATIRTLIEGGSLDDTNFADNAGIPESFFNFTVHDHSDGSLAPFSVKNHSIDYASPPVSTGTIKSRRTQFIMTQGPGTVALFGISPRFPMTVALLRDRLYFGAGATTPSIFAAGTIPVVVTTLATYHAVDTTKYYRLMVEEVTSSYFTYRYTSDDTAADSEAFFYYLAIGAAPGYIGRPGS